MQRKAIAAATSSAVALRPTGVVVPCSASPAPRSGTESAACADPELEDFLHLYLANRGILITPFHNMALMCPSTTDADVDLHTRLFDEAVSALVP